MPFFPAFGRAPSRADLARYRGSPQLHGDRFDNALLRHSPPLLPMLWRWFTEGRPNGVPVAPIPVEPRVRADYDVAPAEPRVTWLGHSILLVEIDGKRLLIDPLWSPYASPGAFFGVKRFFPSPLPWDELPSLDAVLLSHDHYDHLDATVIQRFARMATIPRFIVPLGVGTHLRAWGIPDERITELDWWGETAIGELRIVATPSRHFSGRLPWTDDTTLWCGFALLGAARRLYYAGDSAMFDGFAAIGERLGPFDLTMIEIGAYDPSWPDVHMGPEQALAAHFAVRGRTLLPVHWGLFSLAFHGWTEPIERLLTAAAGRAEVTVPRPGGRVTVGEAATVDRWWPALPWRSADERPIVSTMVPRPTPA